MNPQGYTQTTTSNVSKLTYITIPAPQSASRWDDSSHDFVVYEFGKARTGEANMTDILKDFLGNESFWAAVVILLLSLQAWLLPTMPQTVVDALHVCAVVAFGIIAARYATQQAQTRADVARMNVPK